VADVLPHDLAAMRTAVAAAATARVRAHPNPWVGAVVEPGGFVGATGAPGEAHAEVAALAKAGAAARGATVYVTLEPCCPFDGKRTPSCAGALIEAGVRRVVVALEDPDPRVAGRGLAALRAAGIEVEVGVGAAEAEAQLMPYLTHRRTGRPYVVLKLAATMDGGTAAPDGTSQWITGEPARRDAHRLRAESDAVLVGAGTVRADDPALSVRHVDGPDPERVVLGHAPPGAKVRPCREVSGELEPILDGLGADGVVQLLVEGGASVAGEFHRRGLVDEYVLYLAPALFGGDDARGVFTGQGASTMSELWRGRLVDASPLGDDLRVVLQARKAG
jgi:diaminohydroxyphosphoribosylaminopyrimidine deaminase/5-amino-6-(5-phosphoribosylamino)uracil reductase